MINGLNIQERNIFKYLNLAKNEIPSYIRCATNKEDLELCIEKKFISMSFSNLDECYTLSYLKYLRSVKKRHFKRDIEILFNNYLVYNKKLLDLNPQILIHDPKQLPSLTFTDDLTKSGFSLIEFKRLPPPYDTNCFDYENRK